ncbi:unnamed protein product [Acanthoscelides obtectus]|uniref:Coronin n=1 Tax=Acanthoscelides obtectus TaxID=200917 RepID=A0A9P0M693_ACAOB|nr:unnamed protein product [Acanthoscelides obtectus]CAK1679604.1 Coronin-7 [Acanthoscelides obtectus]
MAWRFKASKYKNAAPIVPKPENYVRDICVGSYQTYGNNIAASAMFMAFNWEHAGSSLAVLPINDFGRKSKLMPLLHGHTDTVTDMEFSPFHDGLLATGSQDCLVKIWHIPTEGLEESLSNPECTFSHKQRRVEMVGFHPCADFLLHSTSYTTLTLWDLISEQEIFSNADHTEVIQSVSWKRDGTLLVTSCKDKQLRVLDPRTQQSCLKSANSHAGIKDSRVVWLGEQDRVLSTGFDAQRLRQIIIRDLRNFSQPEKTLELDCSTGILIPLYDADTGMLFLAGKGDTTIGYWEVSDRDPYLIEGIRHSGEQTKGVCLVPKRALNVMQGQVNRILQLTSSSVIPIMYQVPRKTYRDFHSDLYPDTPGYKTELTASMWMQGKNIPLPKINLDPAKRENGEEPIVVHRGSLQDLRKESAEKAKNAEKVPETKPKITTTIPKSDFHPVRSIVRDFEKDNNKPDELKEPEETITSVPSEAGSKTVTSAPSEVVSKAVTSAPSEVGSKSVASEVGSKTVASAPSEVTSTEKVNDVIIPPKPLPRTSRTSSMCDSLPSSLEDAANAPKPVARPRTNSLAPVVTSVNPTAPISGGYKPRLGPKPFTPPKLDSENTFSKVFSVPLVPGQNGLPADKVTTPVEEKLASPVNESEPQTEEEPKVDDEPQKIEAENGKCSSDEEEAQSESDYTPKTPSTAERRKLFEKSNSKENEGEDTIDTDNFERSSVRTSIAERRKMYEKRSMSVQEPGSISQEKKEGSPVMLRRKDSFKNRKNEEILKEDNRKSVPVSKQQSLDPGRKSEAATPTPKRTSTVFGRVSKFRHLKGTPAHKSFHIENIRNISRQISGECDGFHANPERCAVPLAGPGGKIAIVELSRYGRLPDGVLPSLVNGTSTVQDFAWDPFCDRRLATVCDDGTARLWRIPEGGLPEPTATPEKEWRAHQDKIYFVKWHPTAEDVLATGSYDMTIKIWDLTTLTDQITLRGHVDQMFSFAWSPCGSYCATVSRDSKVRVYKPRHSDQPIREGKGPEGNRGARIVWALDGRYIVVTGFDKVSERQISVYKSNDLSAPLNTIGLDVSPAILIPFYDDDSSTLFVTGRGDSTIYAFEITEESPHICPLSHHRSSTLHQGLSFLTKNICDVSNVEFAKALRLTNNSIEPLSFTVPRIKTDLFQDDLFPDTSVTWTPTLTSSDWFNGKDKLPERMSLKPEGMELLSECQGQANSAPERTINKSASTPYIGASANKMNWDNDSIKNKQEEVSRILN